MATKESSDDEIWAQLFLWVDSDADGKVSKDDMMKVFVACLSAIS